MNLKIIKYCLLLCCFWTSFSHAFTCKTSAGSTVSWGGGSANVQVPLTPTVQQGSYLIVDLANYITCKNDSLNALWTDYIRLIKGTTFNGALSGFSGTIGFSGNNYPLPFNGSSSNIIKLPAQNTVSIPIKLSLTPVSSASPVNGVLIKAGTLIASIVMNQQNNGNFDSANFTWNIYAQNDVVIPQAACTVDGTNNITVTLPNYPGSAQIPLTIRCTSNQTLGFYIYGSTQSDGSTFINTLESNNDPSSAHGVGVQVIRNGVAVQTNRNQTLGVITTAGKDLGLSARYNQLGSTQITAGNVRSIVNLNFVYP